MHRTPPLARPLLACVTTALLVAAASPARADRWVAENRTAKLIWAPAFKHEELKKEKLGRYNPEAGEEQYGVFVANFEDAVFILYEVWTSVKWDRDFVELLEKAPPELERFSLRKLSRTALFPGAVPCGTFIQKVRDEIKKNTSTPYTSGRFSWKTPPVIVCHQALVLKPRGR